ncbi:nucleotide exchange factor GrpE [Buchnera aphidicola]|uniref:nucleotide exchange factor GrpE n=1 Tax=Buchnera aphidicola TaxID=9 RepID=UPI00094D4AEF|nr:nucleotide exchange factor GrpE [Buchnera aphidicola]
MKENKKHNQTNDNKKDNIEKKEKKNSSIVKKIEEKIVSCKKEKKNIRLRYYAEIDNLIKKNKKEIKNIKKQLFKEFLKSIFPVIDKIDYLVRNSHHTHVSQNSVLEGIKLTQNIFEKSLKSWSIKKINQINVPFDSQIHNLKSNQESDIAQNKKIIKTIIQNGYIFKKKIIKKAIVGL